MTSSKVLTENLYRQIRCDIKIDNGFNESENSQSGRTLNYLHF